MKEKNWNRWIYIWLITGLIMIIFQIVLGGITRLTGSGLSITRWDIITGMIFPYTDKMWQEHFELYQETPQYLKINNGLSLDDFKYIFFWEYFHRLWARIMGLVFIIPFFYFLIKRKLTKNMIINLVTLCLLAFIVASLGWIMVKSGLLERPWVNAYKLSIHLLFAVILLSFLIYIIFNFRKGSYEHIRKIPKLYYFISGVLLVLVFFQLFLGGVVAGMRASMVAPTWPDINGEWIPTGMLTFFEWNYDLLNHYEDNPIIAITFQFFHRLIGYIIFIFLLFILIKVYRSRDILLFRNFSILFIGIVFQILLGILTLFYSVGSIPVHLGAGHQFFGICIYSYSFYNLLWIRKNTEE